jgi:hypothetical protein
MLSLDLLIDSADGKSATALSRRSTRPNGQCNTWINCLELFRQVAADVAAELSGNGLLLAR